MLKSLRVPNIVRDIRNISTLIDISEEVSVSLKRKKPVVALESTIITHGMPYPQNVATALEVEQIIRSKDVVPATIAVLNGRIKVGLSTKELEYLSDPNTKSVKTSRRDFPFVTAMKLNGGTTVSGTLLVANQVGIPLFVTGGIGGVHRGVDKSWDISADLRELGRTPVMVVCSGIKSILDIDKSLEFLETEGALVVTFGKDRVMPSFYSATSQSKSAYNVETFHDAAKLLDSNFKMNGNSGIVLAVPLPEEYSIDYKMMDSVIQQAIQEAAEKNIFGKEVTPFLLERISKLTDGQSLESNIALIKNNAHVGAEVALEYCKLSSRCHSSVHVVPKLGADPVSKISQKKAIVFGGAVVDSVLTLQQQVKLDGRTVSGRRTAVAGGVGRNLAEALSRLGPKTTFVSTLGRDPGAAFILDSLILADTTRVETVDSLETASFTVLVDNKGECLLVAGDTSIFSTITKERIFRNSDGIHSSDIVVIDSNVPAESIHEIISISSLAGVPTWFEPTDMSICNRILANDSWQNITFMSPNILELKTMASEFGTNINDVSTNDSEKLLQQVIFMAKPLAEKLDNLMVTMGKHGILIFSKRETNDSVFGKIKKENITQARYYPVEPITSVVNASGAGDCGAAGFIIGALAGLDEAQCMAIAQQASWESLKSNLTVPERIHEILEHSLPPMNYHQVPLQY